ncbi:aromatic amino acid lyase [Streptomyces asoensis]|uniref:Aromatic amino acid lyase n=1 Tax=Streptomyces asoensis TaxID=249586 RepID=A0A6M4X9I6_9ACTN|nr:aromatic amino acid lyase [Streptomyces asoensis]QJT04793.1 aromatic amino acid lyase [Streptomyces asoensis]
MDATANGSTRVPPQRGGARTVLNGTTLTVGELIALVDGAAVPTVAHEARERAAHSWRTAQRLAAAGRLYGRGTGVGAQRSVPVDEGDEAAHGLRLLRSHAGGAGALLPDRQVRAMLAVRANQLLAGGSGIQPALIDALVDALRLGVHPAVNEYGAVGTGDLTALAQTGLTLIGEQPWLGTESAEPRKASRPDGEPTGRVEKAEPGGESAASVTGLAHGGPSVARTELAPGGVSVTEAELAPGGVSVTEAELAPGGAPVTEAELAPGGAPVAWAQLAPGGASVAGAERERGGASARPVKTRQSQAGSGVPSNEPEPEPDALRVGPSQTAESAAPATAYGEPAAAARCVLAPAVQLVTLSGPAAETVYVTVSAPVTAATPAPGAALSTGLPAPVVLQPGDALALLSSNALALGQAALAQRELDVLLRATHAVAALSLAAVSGSPEAYAAPVHALRPYPGAARAAGEVRRLLGLPDRPQGRQGRRIQDPFGFRAFPQAHGCALDASERLREVIEVEINCPSENPLMDPDGTTAYHHGGFFAAPLGLALDAANLALLQTAQLSTARLTALGDPGLTGLPPFLGGGPATSSGTMILEYTANSALAELRSGTMPASAGHAVLSRGLEEAASFAGQAARQTSRATDAYTTVLACELVAAVRALRMRSVQAESLPPPVEVFAAATAVLPAGTEDRPLTGDVTAAAELLPGLAEL